jgi:predicted amidophosphoribosyltransferase
MSIPCKGEQMNCDHCQSKIFESDRTCPQCGAPNNNIIQKKECFGEVMCQIENGMVEVRRGIDDQLLYVYYNRIMAGLPGKG